MAIGAPSAIVGNLCFFHHAFGRVGIKTGQSHIISVFAADHFAGHQMIFGAIDSMRNGQITCPLTCAQPHFDMGVAEFGVRPGHHHIAQQRQIGTEPQRITMHGGDNRFLTFENMVNNAPPLSQVRISIPVSALKSPTQNALPAPASTMAQIGVIVKIAAECHHFMMHAIVDGVHFLRPIERHNDNTIVTAVNGHTLVFSCFSMAPPNFNSLPPTASLVQVKSH